MSELFLVRHGQASFGAANYDQLSELGYQQSQWLGEYFQEREIGFDRVITGSLARQKQTATGILEALSHKPAMEEDTGFNEFDFHALVAIYCNLTETPLPRREDGIKAFFQLLRRAMKAWAQDELRLQHSAHDTLPPLETWGQFHDRVARACSWQQADERSQRILVVSSGGAIAMILSQVLQCSVDALINLNLQAKNTGLSQLFFNQRGMLLSSFNHTPHLDTTTRRHALTFT